MKKFIIFILLFTLNSITSNAEVFKGVGYSKDNVDEADSIALLSLSKLFKVKVVNEYTKNTISDNFYYNSEIKHNISVDSGIDFGTTKINREINMGEDGTIKVIRSIDVDKHLSEINKQIDSLCNRNNISEYLSNYCIKKNGYDNAKYWFNFLSSYEGNILLGNFYKSYQILDNDFMDIVNPDNQAKKNKLKDRALNIRKEVLCTHLSEEDGRLIGVGITMENLHTDLNNIKKPFFYRDSILLNRGDGIQYEMLKNNEWVELKHESKYENLYVNHIIDVSHLKNRFDPIYFRAPFITIINDEFVKMNVPEEWYNVFNHRHAWWYQHIEWYGEHGYAISSFISKLNYEIRKKIISYEYAKSIESELKEYILSIDPKAIFR